MSEQPWDRKRLWESRITSMASSIGAVLIGSSIALFIRREDIAGAVVAAAGLMLAAPWYVSNYRHRRELRSYRAFLLKMQALYGKRPPS